MPTTNRPRNERRLIRQPIHDAASLIARSLLDRAQRASGLLAGGAEGEALHDFRVAVRRLRTWLRVYAAWLPESAVAFHRPLRGLTTSTNQGRDLEVHLAWLRAELARKRLARRMRSSLETAAEILEAAEAKRLKAASGAVEDFGTLERRLRTVIGKEPSGDASTPAPKHGAITSTLLEIERMRFRCWTESLQQPEQLWLIHRARLKIKRMRYILDPIKSEIPWGVDATRRLKRLQETLGTLRDTQTLRDAVAFQLERTSRKKKLSAVTADLQLALQHIIGREQGLFDRMRRSWEQGEIRRLDTRLYKVIMTLSRG